MGLNPEGDPMKVEIDGTFIAVESVEEENTSTEVPWLLVEDTFALLAASEIEDEQTISNLGYFQWNGKVPDDFEARFEVRYADNFFHNQAPDKGIDGVNQMLGFNVNGSGFRIGKGKFFPHHR